MHTKHVVFLVAKQQEGKEQTSELLPLERVLKVKPLWAQLGHEQRREMLSMSLTSLRLKASMHPNQNLPGKLRNCATNCKLSHGGMSC